jgi:hypothetical protein
MYNDLRWHTDPILIRDELLSMLLAARDTVCYFAYHSGQILILLDPDSVRFDIHNIFHGHHSSCRGPASRRSSRALWA